VRHRLFLLLALAFGCKTVDEGQARRDLANLCPRCRLLAAAVGEGDAAFMYVSVKYQDEKGALVNEEWQYRRAHDEWRLERRTPQP
jgi:hypothetical protein